MKFIEFVNNNLILILKFTLNMLLDINVKKE